MPLYVLVILENIAFISVLNKLCELKAIYDNKRRKKATFEQHL